MFSDNSFILIVTRQTLKITYFRVKFWMHFQHVLNHVKLKALGPNLALDKIGPQSQYF